MINSQESYFNTFGVGEAQLSKLVEAALEHGGDYADLFFENSTYRELVLRDGKVSTGGFHVDYGVGIRVLKGDKTGYAYSESTQMRDMLATAEAASAIAMGSDTDGRTAAKIVREARSTAATYTVQHSNGDRLGRRFFPGRPNPAADRYPVAMDWRSAAVESLKPYLEKLETAIRRKDSRVLKVIGILEVSMSDILMYNSFSELKYDTRPMGTLAASVVLSDGKSIENSHVSRSFRMGAEMLTEDLIEGLAEQVTSRLDDKFSAKRPKGGVMPVVMGAGASGILLHEAMGHSFEADFNRKGQSIFAHRLGQKVCMDGINIVDDGTIRGNRGALNFDDEGVPGQRTCMVENGVLASYLHDRISAKFYGVTPTGNGRRESFRYNPIPRMRATYMEGGNSEPESIIASVKKGIYVDEFSNGEVKIGEGDFTFYVKSGYLIENGRLTMPVKDINIIGNGPKALADIVAVGNDPKIDDAAWTCGKEQSAAVSCGIPTVLVKELTVGGE